MAGSAHQPDALTIADYDRFVTVQADDREWEFVDGELVMMSKPTENHEQNAGNIGAPLKFAMDAAGCRSYQGGMRVQRADDSRGLDKTKPDVVVRCGPRQNRTYVTDPPVVVEVLPPSTMDHDRGGKLKFYKSLPTLRHIALIYQDQMRVEHYERTDEGWRLDVLTVPDETLRFDAVGFEIEVERIYFDVPVLRPVMDRGAPYAFDKPLRVPPHPLAARGSRRKRALRMVRRRRVTDDRTSVVASPSTAKARAESVRPKTRDDGMRTDRPFARDRKREERRPIGPTLLERVGASAQRWTMTRVPTFTRV